MGRDTGLAERLLPDSVQRPQRPGREAQTSLSALTNGPASLPSPPTWGLGATGWNASAGPSCGSGKVQVSEQK